MKGPWKHKKEFKRINTYKQRECEKQKPQQWRWKKEREE